ncbi:response regulator [Synechococcus elongatus]|uniref:Response regulator n=1 Tax=Synechococcus elongatus PCC 11802 TaxID=2283154 RepID=A0AAT9JTR4_SYNEL|nr:response regulator [Synechococcus elongatus]QFZ92511.1 response regulator [Synechococcus elongatus PCC 11802]
MANILVVDDSSLYLELARQALAEHGHHVTLANNGQEALQTIAQQKPDLILLDIVMPEMNGYDVLRSLKKSPDTASIPVILCSTKGEDFDKYWGLKQGATAYLTKPYEVNDLLVLVQEQISAAG